MTIYDKPIVEKEVYEHNSTFKELCEKYVFEIYERNVDHIFWEEVYSINKLNVFKPNIIYMTITSLHNLVRFKIGKRGEPSQLLIS